MINMGALAWLEMGHPALQQHDLESDDEPVDTAYPQGL